MLICLKAHLRLEAYKALVPTPIDSLMGPEADAFLETVTRELDHDFGIGHSTIQIEQTSCERAGSCLGQ